MAINIKDPLLKAKAASLVSEAEESLLAPPSPPNAQLRKKTARKPGSPHVPAALTPHPTAPTPEEMQDAAFVERLKADFRLFLIVIWRHLLGVDPAPIMLDMAYWLQHGPDRSIVQAFRGFSKSWITGAYALWRLFVNPQEKILVVSGSLTRAVATTNWCLALIMELPLLQHLRPMPHQRQSSKAFDVGPATPDQSPSFHALGIGGQIVGFRGDCIIPDDVETQQNSLTVVMRDKIREAVKEFDSVLKPGGVIKYLGTPHDEDSLYNKLTNEAGYSIRIWPARYPDAKQIKKYGTRLAPYILKMLEKHGPSLVGRSVMPTRFTDTDLAKRELSLGRSEFALQFMLDTSLADQDKYPLKLKDLMVMSLDSRKGPESLAWSNEPKQRIQDVTCRGFDGDFLYSPVIPDGVTHSPWSSVVAAIDPSGKGADETGMVILAELMGYVFWLKLFASRDGYSPKVLKEMADLCVQFAVNKVKIEENFGGGMFASLFKPYLTKAWEKENERRAKLRKNLPAQAHLYQDGGTEVEELRSTNTMNKEKRILGLMEPVTQQHRLVVSKEVLEWDQRSVEQMEAVDTRNRYLWQHQYTRLTRVPGALDHDDRIDCLALGISEFADIIGVNPDEMLKKVQQEREEEHIEKLLGWEEEEYDLPNSIGKHDSRAASLSIQKR